MNGLSALFGREFGNEDFVALFSLRLDETGTDGRSPYAVVAGAVATHESWLALESAWAALCGNSWHYHWEEFCDRDGPFAGWSNLKRGRFVDKQEKIINKNTLFRITYGVDRAAHAEIKARMKGISGFRADSDYGLCIRALMFHTSEQLFKIDPGHQLALLVENGPWAAGALKLYQAVSRMTGKWKPAKHAHRLAGFAVAAKGKFRSLEAADYICGSELQRLRNGKLGPRTKDSKRLGLILGKKELERWYEGMIEEKEHRRAHAAKKRAFL